MTSLTRWVLAHKRIVVIVAVALTLVGMASAGSATKAMKQKFSVPGKEGWITNQQIERDFHGTGGNRAPLLAVVTLPAGQSVGSPTVRGGLHGVESRLETVLPGSRVAGYASTSSSAFLSKDGHTTFIVAYPPPDPNQPFGDNPNAAKKASAALAGATVAGTPVHLTGVDALSVQSGGGNGPGVLLEALLGGFGALLVLTFVFGSFLAIVPIMMAGVSILTTFLVVWGLTAVTEVSPIVQFLIALVGLSKIGSRLDWPHIRDDSKASRSWTGWANLVVRRRWLAALGGALVLAALVLAATNLQLGISNVNTIAKQGDAKQGLLALERSGIGAGALMPHETLVSGSTPPEGVARTLAALPGVRGAVAPDSPQWRSPDSAVVDAFATADASSAEGRATLDRVRSAVRAQPDAVRLGGLPAQNADFINAVYGNFPLMIALIALITFVLLARAFRSLLLPLKAVILNVISVGAAWGVLQLVWQAGHGSNLIWGISATGSITAWIPLMVFAFLFGLSMDYEVFILARMREEYDATGSTNTAVVKGISRTGRLVTSAALILFLAFISLASGPETEVKVLATGLAAGILLDATIIRALFVPAVVSLFGRWNWWLPQLPARLLRVAPSPSPRLAAGAEGSGP